MLIGKVKWYHHLIILYCFFVYFFPFKAYGFDPRFLVFFFYAFYAIKHNLKIKLKGIKVKYIQVLLYPFMMLLFTVFSSTINTVTENTFIIFPFQIIYLLILSYCTYDLTKRFHKSIDFYLLTKYFLGTLVIQAIIAIIMFINESIRSFMFALQNIDPNSKVIEMFLGARLVGLGCFYFGAGIIYGFALIAMIPLILKSQTYKNRLLQMILYSFLFIVGIFFARTTLIGATLSFAYLFCCIFIYSIKQKALSVIRQFFTFIISSIIILTTIYASSPQLQEDYGKIIKFGFEAFINLSEKGELSTASSDGLKEYHLNIWPQNSKTYYIGDTRWTNGDSYYGDSDVGYVRLLYYFGIPGTILFLLYQYSIAKVSSLPFSEKILKLFFWTMMVYAPILLIKGYTDTASMLFIYLHHNQTHFKNENSTFC